MARLQINPYLLLAQLFNGKVPDVTLRGASFNASAGVVELDIEGPPVPDAERVVAIVTVNEGNTIHKVEFQAI